MTGNEDVTFSGNSAHYGGAIYNNLGSFTLCGNGDVLFEKNAQMSNGSYRLRSIYSMRSLNLSATQGKSILFKDSVFASGVFELNQDGAGDIIFTGATTEADLREVKGGVDGTAEEIQNSRTSEIATMTNLYRGRLIVEDKAVLMGRGITAAADSGATVRVKDGTLDHSGFALTFNNSTTFEAEGVNSVTASSVDMMSGSTLSFGVDDANLTTAALTLTGTLTTGAISVTISGLDDLEAGNYTYALLSATSYDVAAWTEDKITVTTEGVSFDDLVWDNGTLYFNYAVAPALTTATWNNGSGDGMWNTSSHNWTQETFTYQYKDGVDVVFSNTGAGTVNIEGVLAPKRVTVNSNSAYTWIGSGSLVGSMSLLKQGTGTLSISNANSYSGGTIIEKGIVSVQNQSALGTGAVSITGGKLEVRDGVNLTIGSLSVENGGGLRFTFSQGVTESSLLTLNGDLSTDTISIDFISMGKLNRGDSQRLIAISSGNFITKDNWTEEKVLLPNTGLNSGVQNVLFSDFVWDGNVLSYNYVKRYVYSGKTEPLSAQVRDYDEVIFENNQNGEKSKINSTPYGAALRGSSSNFEFSDNTSILFNNNSTYSSSISVCGGAVSGYGYVTNLSFSNNGNITFSNNLASTYGSADRMDAAQGGAIYKDYNTALVFKGNESVSFINNTADSMSGNAYGGAIYISSASLAFIDNGSLVFEGNSARAGTYWYNDHVYNSTAIGGAIYSLGQLTIYGSAIFENNAEGGNGSLLRSIYHGPYALSLSAPTGGSIEFRDSIYSESKTVKFNQQYEKTDGSMQTADGDILFTGKYVADDWRSRFGNDGSDERLLNSRTSEIKGIIHLYGGKLKIEDAAVLNAGGVSLLSGANATLALKSATLKAGTGNVVISSGSSLHSSGVSTMVVATLDLQTGSTLSFGIDDANFTTAALTLTGTLTTETISVAISGLEDLEAGRYTYALMKASTYNTSAWTADKITIATDGVSFDDLVWQNGTLYLNYSNLPVLSSATWSNGSGDGKWNAASLNWTQGGYSYAYADGVDVIFGDTGAGTVSLVGNLAPKSVLVDNGSGFDYTFSGEGKLTGSTALTMQGEGKLTITTANDYTGGTTINGGTLVAGNAAALGSGTVTLNSGTLEIAANGFANGITFAGDSSLMVDEGYELLLNKRIVNTSYNLALGGSITFKDISSTSNGGAIYNNGTNATFTLNGDGAVTFSGNTVTGNYFHGGAIYNSAGTFTLSGNGGVTFSKNSVLNSATSSGVAGGAIYNCDSSSFMLSRNEVVIFSGNTVSSYSSSAKACGGAIDNSATFTLSENGVVTFSGNTAAVYTTGTFASCRSCGGAIDNSGTFTLSRNGAVTFIGNKASVGRNGSYGGAIYNSGAFTLSGNGDVIFNENSVSNEGSSILFGGAIYNCDSATFTMCDNGDVIFSKNRGCAIYNIGSGTVFTLSGNGDIIFSENTNGYCSAIYNSGAFTLNGNGDVTFSGNSNALGSAIINYGTGTTFSLSGNKNVIFSENSVYADSSSTNGGAIRNEAAFILNGNTGVSFTNNRVHASANDYSPFGGAIYNSESGDFTLSNNGDIVFRENSILGYDSIAPTGQGGAIYNAGIFTFTDNGNISFIDNKSYIGGAIYNAGTFELRGNGNVLFRSHSGYAGSITYYSRPGAIYNSGNFSVVENNDVSLCDNQADCGGAVYNTHIFTLEGNTTVTFNGNSAYYAYTDTYGGAIYNTGSFTLSDNGAVTFRGNKASCYSSASSYGGAIYNGGSFALVGNESVTFSENSVSSSYVSYGGAIYNARGSIFTLSGNKSVTFSGNQARNTDSTSVYGGAICNVGTFTLSGNGDILFEKNAEVRNGSSYRLRGIYSTGTLNLSSSEGKSILFKDSIYASGTVNLNQDYTDSEGVVHKSTGDIIFSGATTIADLKEVKGGVAGTASEITNSRTSEIATMTNLYGGRLIVEDKAILKGRGITAAADSAATVRVKDGTLNHSGYALTFNNSTKLEAEGASSITASTVAMKAGSTLSFVVGEENLTTAALTLTGTLTTETISVAISGLDDLEAGRYTYALMKASTYNTSAWTADKITVTTEGVSFDDLVWDNGTLYLNYSNLPVLSSATWNNGSGDGKWNATSLNWTQDGYSYAYANGVDVIFGDTGAGTVSLVGNLVPKSVLVDNGSGFDYTFSGTGKLTGTTALTKQGAGKLTINTANDYTGGTTINGSTLVAGNAAALGTGTVAVNGGTLEIAANGFANDTSFAGTSSLVVDAGYQLALSKMLANSGVLTVSGTLNASSLMLNTIAATHVDVNGNSGTSGFAKGALYSVQVVNGGTTSGADATITHLNLPTGEMLVLGENGIATAGGAIDYSEYLLTGSATAATSSIHAKGASATVTQNGGTLTVDDTVTVTTTAGNIALNGGTLNGTVSGATINATSGVLNAALSGTNTLNGTSYALQSVITNSGVLTVSGTINAAALTLDTTAATHIDVNGNSGASGFAKDAIYAVTLANGTTVNSGATTTHGEHTLTLGTDGVAKTGGAIDYSEYLLTGSATATTSAIHAKGVSATVTQNGGRLTVDDAVTVATTGGTLALNGGTLNGTVSSATINATSGALNAALSGNNMLNGTNYALQSVIANSGVLTVSGTINAAALTLDTTAATHIDVNGNSGASGFAKDAIYAVTIAEGTTVNSGATITHGEHMLTLGTDGVAKTSGAIDYSEYLLTDSATATTSAIHAKGVSATVTQNGGRLTVDDAVTVTTTGGTLALNGGTLNGTVSGATINATSGALNAALSGNNTLNGTNYALGNVLTNEGSLTISGTVSTDALTLNKSNATHINVAGASGANGFAKTDYYEVQLVNGGTVVNNNATITHTDLPTELTLALGTNGIANAGGVVDYSNYLLVDATTSVSAIHGVAGASAASVTQTGGNLTIDDSVTVTTIGGTVSLTSGTVSGSISNAVVTASGGRVNAAISGDTKVTSDGVVTLAGNNTYTGLTTVNSGTLTSSALAGDMMLNGGTLAIAEQTLSSAQTLTFNGGDFAGALSTGNGSMLLSANGSIDGALTLNGGSITFNGYSLAVAGTLTLDSATALDVGALTEGSYTLIRFDDVVGSTDYLTIVGTELRHYFSTETGALVLHLLGEGAQDIVFPNDGEGASWGEGSFGYQDGDDVSFDSTGDISLDGELAPGHITVTGDGNSSFIGSGSITGETGINKEGEGTLTMNDGNSYTGTTSINGGTVIAGGDTSFGTGDIALNNGTLHLNGHGVNNDITVENGSLNGGANYGGELTVNGSLTLGGETTAKDIVLNGGSITGGSIVDTAIVANGGSIGSTITGSSSVTSTGDVTLSGNNSYTGGTTVDGGTLTAGGDTAFGTGDIALNNGTLHLNGHGVNNDMSLNGGVLVIGGELTLAEGQSLVFNGGSVQGNVTSSAGANIALEANGTIAGSLTLNGGTLALNGHSLTVTDSLTLSGETTLDVSAYGVGTYTLLTFGHLEGSLDKLIPDGSDYRYFLTQQEGALTLQVKALNNSLTWSVNKGEWKTDAAFGDGVFRAGDDVAFCTAATVTISGEVNPGIVLVDSAAKITFKNNKKVIGSGIAGDCSVTKSGAGVLTMNAGNTYSGGTVLNAGTIKATAADSFGTGVITVKGGTLDLGGKAVANDIVLSGTASLKSDAKYVGNVSVDGNAMLLAKTSYKGMTTIGEGSTLTLAEKATMAGSIAVDGTLRIRDAKGLTLAKGATMTLDKGGSVSGLLTIGAGSTLVWADGSFETAAPVLKGGTLDLGAKNSLTLTGSKAQVAFGDKRVELPGKGVVYTDETLTVDGGTVTLSAVSGYDGSIEVAGGTLKLATGDNEIVVSGNAAVVNGKTHNGNITVNGTLAKGTNITIADGKTVELNGTGVMLGTIAGAGTVDVNASIDATAAKITAAHINLNNGTYTNAKGIKLAKGQSLTLGGVALNLGPKGALATAAGSTLAVNGSNTLSGNLTLGGGELVFNNGSLAVEGGTLTLSKAMTVRGSGVITYAALKPFKGDIAVLFGGANVKLDTETGTLTFNGGVPKMMSLGPAPLDSEPVAWVEETEKLAPAPLDAAPAPMPAANPVADAVVQADWGIIDAERAFMGAVNSRHQHAALLDKGRGAAWVSAFGAAVRHGNKGAHHGSDGNLSGAAFGLEHAVSETGSIGLAVGRSKNRIAATGVTHLRQETAHVALYGQKQIAHGFTADAAATYGDTETKLGAAAWQQKSAALTARLTHAQQLTDATAFRTFGGLAYEATDKGSIGTAHSGSVQNVRGELGAGITHRAGKAHLYAEAALTGDMVRHNPTADLDGTRTHGANPGRLGIRATVGGLYAFTDTWSGTASYSIETESRSTAHTLNIGVSKSF